MQQQQPVSTSTYIWCQPLPRKNIVVLLLSTEESTRKRKKIQGLTKGNSSGEQYEDTSVSVISWPEHAEEIRDGRIWWGLNDLMKEYPDSMVTKPLLIEFSISHRTVWRHPIQVNDALTADVVSTLIGMVGRSGRNQERIKVVDLMATDPVI